MNVFRNSILALAIVSLQACSTIFPKTVEIPVPVPCKVADIEKPKMYFDDGAKESMSLYDKLSLLLAQDYAQKGYVTKLQAALDACRKTN